MGSSNVKCGITHYTIGPDEPTVSFFLEQTGRPINRALRGLMDHWRPLHFPVFGLYEDYGYSIPVSPSQLGVETAKMALQGFDFSEKSWSKLGQRGLAPSPSGPVDHTESPIMLWHMRRDVYDQIARYGQEIPLARAPETKAFFDAFGPNQAALSAPHSEESENFCHFLKGLESLGFAFRKTTGKCSQMADVDKQKLLPKMKKIALIDSGPSEPYDDNIQGKPQKMAVWRCGITGKPVLPNQKAVVIPLKDNRLVEPDGSPDPFVNNHLVNGHYLFGGAPVTVQINSSNGFTPMVDGDPDVARNLVNSLVNKDTIRMRSVRHDRDCQHAAMVISLPVYEHILAGSRHSKDQIQKDLEQFIQEAEALASLAASDNLATMSEWIKANVPNPESSLDLITGYSEEHPERLPNIFLRVAERHIKRLRSGERSNVFSDLACFGFESLDVESQCKLDEALLDVLEDGIMPENAKRPEAVATLKNTLESFAPMIRLRGALAELAVPVHPTERRFLPIAPKTAAIYWDELHKKVLRNIDIELQNRDCESEFSF